MSTTVVGFGGSCQLELECRQLTKAQNNLLFNLQRTRVQIFRRRSTIRKISAVAAGYNIAGVRTDSVEAWNAEEKSGNGKKDVGESLVTKYLDEQLSKLLFSASDPVRQIVLLTDATDTRPYRLSWPSPSVIFDVSPGHTHDVTLRKMTASGLKVPKSCLVQHVSEDFSADEYGDENLVERLLRVGYRGDKPSVWLVEMRSDCSHGYLEKILPVASSLLMKDSVFIGAVPVFNSREVENRELLRKLFANNGFLAEIEAQEDVDSEWISESSSGQALYMAHDRPRFLTLRARQLRLSDSQVEYARMQIMMAEEEGDEEGFIDAW